MELLRTNPYGLSDGCRGCSGASLSQRSFAAAARPDRLSVRMRLALGSMRTPSSRWRSASSGCANGWGCWSRCVRDPVRGATSEAIARSTREAESHEVAEVVDLLNARDAHPPTGLAHGDRNRTPAIRPLR
jgi:hypothetical protein